MDSASAVSGVQRFPSFSRVSEAKQHSLGSIQKTISQKIKESKDPFFNDILSTFNAQIDCFLKNPQGESFLKGMQESINDLGESLVGVKDTEGLEGFSEKMQSLLFTFDVAGVHLAAQGKVKAIYTGSDKENIAYAPLQGKGLLGGIQVRLRSKEIQEEVRTAEAIRERSSDPADLQNIACDYKLSQDSIGGQYTVETKRALGDLEKAVKQKDFGYPKSMNYASQLLHGICCLHKVNFVQGDVKLENVLFYEGDQVKISDFGKARVMDSKGHGIYLGNPRYAPPEGRLSQKGEVYGAAICMIRLLEKQFLNEAADPLVSIEPGRCKDTSKSASGRKGVERFLVQDPRCLQTELSGWKPQLKVLLGRVSSVVSPPSQEKLDNAEIAIHQYIDTLTEKLKTQGMSDFKINSLRALLKDMTLSNPEKRISAQEADTAMKRLMASN